MFIEYFQGSNISDTVLVTYRFITLSLKFAAACLFYLVVQLSLTDVKDGNNLSSNNKVFLSLSDSSGTVLTLATDVHTGYHGYQIVLPNYMDCLYKLPP